MTSRELTEWKAEYRRAPWTHDYLHYLLAQIAQVTSNMWRGKGSEPKAVTEFIPWHHTEFREEQSSDDIFRVVRSVTRVK